MGNVVYLAGRNHARASTTSRAAKEARTSAVTALSAARPVAITETHHSAGMLSRCHHLDTADAPAPISKAIASREGQSSITDRNVLIFIMPENLGQFVLKRKANMSLDGKITLGHTVRMAENETEAQFKQQFTQRVKDARRALGWKQWQMAEALDMPQDKYKTYEGRSYLPHRLIGRFCLITRVDPEWLVTGRGEKPLQPLRAVDDDEDDVRVKPRKSKARKVA